MKGEPFRILFHLSHFGRGGTETSLINWLHSLDRRIFAPSISVSWESEDLGFWVQHAIPQDVPVHILSSNRTINRLNRLARVRKLRPWEKFALKSLTYAMARPSAARVFRRLTATHDVIIDFDCSLRHLAGRFSRPWIAVSHYSFNARLSGKGRSYVKRRIRHYNRYDMLAVLNPSMYREAEKWIGPSDLRIVELPNIVDPERLMNLAAAALPKGLPLDYFVCVARLDKSQKDHKTLFSALSLLRGRGDPVHHLLLVGDGPDREYLERLAVELGIRDLLSFTGFTENPFPLIRGARALILSSRYEGMPMVLAEAMALGTPVISSDCPTGPRDLLEDGRCGILTPIGDAEALALAMKTFCENELKRKHFADLGRAKVADFSPMSANQRMLRLMEELFPSRRHIIV
jgi:glycosyltransferase involved in cell wall biosynthesis